MTCFTSARKCRYPHCVCPSEPEMTMLIIPNGSDGPPLPKEPWWKVYVQLYRELFCGARWYDAEGK